MLNKTQVKTKQFFELVWIGEPHLQLDLFYPRSRWYGTDTKWWGWSVYFDIEKNRKLKDKWVRELQAR